MPEIEATLPGEFFCENEDEQDFVFVAGAWAKVVSFLTVLNVKQAAEAVLLELLEIGERQAKAVLAVFRRELDLALAQKEPAATIVRQLIRAERFVRVADPEGRAAAGLKRLLE